MTTLREARDKGKLEQFLKEREAEHLHPGDSAAFNKMVGAMAGKSKRTVKGKRS